MRPDATDLIGWANRLDCRARLPELVRRLVHATATELSLVDIPAGEGVQRPGVDGEVIAGSSSPFVPAGRSIWEIGCSKQVRAKADLDYKKRTESPPTGIVPSHTTFVFVTPRSWTGRAEWAAARRAEGIWADVRAYDADSIEQWLELSLPVSSWLASMVGQIPDTVPIEEYWEEWSAKTSPPTSDSLLLAGRAAEQEAVLRWIRETPRCLTVVVDDQAEAVAFLLAVLRQLPLRESTSFIDRTIVVTSNDMLREVARQARAMLIVATHCDLEVARRAALRGHSILHASSQEVRGEQVKLGAISQSLVAANLERMGLGEETASRLARESRGKISVVRRLLGDDANQLPLELAPLLLLGSWDSDNATDLEYVIKLTGRAEEPLRAILRQNSNGVDPPLRRSRTIYSWVSQVDAWNNLGSAIESSDISRFRDVAIEILRAQHPKYELAVEERFAAELHNKLLWHSEALREGVVGGLVLLATESDVLPDDIDGQSEVDQIVFDIFAGLDSWEQWATLNKSLPSLAEASPDSFLQGARAMLEKDDQPESSCSVERLFQGLMWGLQTLAWNADYLSESTHLLALIAEQEATANETQALDTLQEIFLAWLPHTTADVKSRMAVLDSLCKRHPDLGFQLLVRLAPERHSYSTGTSKPQYRKWLVGWQEGVTTAQLHETSLVVWDRILTSVTTHPELWLKVLPKLNTCPLEHHERAFNAVRSIKAESVTTQQRDELWSALRVELHRHRGFPDASWSINEEDLSALQKAYDALTPTDAKRRTAWLFDRNPELPDFSGHDWKEKIEAVKSAQRKAAKKIASVLSRDAIAVYAEELASPGTFGEALAADDNATSLVQELILDLAGRETQAVGEFRVGLVRELYRRLPDDAVELFSNEKLSQRDRAEIALGLPFQSETWELFDTWGKKTSKHYWDQVNPYWLPQYQYQRDLPIALKALLDSERPIQALRLAAMLPKEGNLSTALVVRILRAAAKTRVASDEPDALQSYDIEKLLDMVKSAGTEWASELLKLEWLWLDRLHSNRHLPNQLFNALENNPQFFIDVLSSLYRAEGQPEKEPTDGDSTKAKHAFRLLKNWNGIPGAREDGSIDGDFLSSWIYEARKLARDKGLGTITDQEIGKVLSFAPTGTDGHWPREEIRRVLEKLTKSSDIERGFMLGRFNQRGVVTKRIGEGGRQERDISVSYENGASALRASYPTTARLLKLLAKHYEGDARFEDRRGARDAEEYIWKAGAEERLAAYVDELQAHGRYSFALSEAKENIKNPGGDIQTAAFALVERARLASPEPGYYVIVPVEYRAAGSPPPTWYIDAWMRWAKEEYYVGLLTAAAFHGAAHHQPQTFQVVIAKERAKITIGRSRLEFVHIENIEAAATIRKQTETGELTLSAPETTALDLVQYASACGGVSAVATILVDLGEELEPGRLATAARSHSVETIQRTGWLLDRVGFSQLARALRAILRDRNPVAIPLRLNGVFSAMPAEPWLVATDRDVEIDD